MGKKGTPKKNDRVIGFCGIGSHFLLCEEIEESGSAPGFCDTTEPYPIPSQKKQNPWVGGVFVGVCLALLLFN